MSRIRMMESNVVFNVSTRTVDRCFLLSPNHHLDMPLLHQGCPREALDLSNDITPVPSTINVVGSAVGRALLKAPINLHAFESNSNHIHQIISADEEQLANLVHFERNANSLIARGDEQDPQSLGRFLRRSPPNGGVRRRREGGAEALLRAHERRKGRPGRKDLAVPVLLDFQTSNNRKAATLLVHRLRGLLGRRR